MSRQNQLYLLADHIRLSLLERRRVQSLGAAGPDVQDGHISRSLEQFRQGLDELAADGEKLREGGDQDAALSVDDSLPSLRRQLDDLTSQFHGFSSPSAAATLATPDDPSLSSSTPPRPGPGYTRKSLLRAPSGSSAPAGSSSPKTVRFSDSPLPPSSSLSSSSAQPQPQPHQQPDPADALFPGRYRDDPADSAGYADRAAAMANPQLQAYHERILDDQDAQLDALGESIGRQRDLSIQIGDELDSHVAMLDEVDGVVVRHQGRLDRARRQLGRIARAGGESRQMMVIVALIVVLILLIAVLK